MRLSRLFMAALLLLAGVGFTGAASAADCNGSGKITVALHPCPASTSPTEGFSGDLAFDATVQGTVSGPIVVVFTDNAHIIQTSHISQSDAAHFRVDIGTNPALAPGTHTGDLGIRVCGDSACRNLYVQLGLPYRLNVTAITPPAITSLSTTSMAQGHAGFTLGVNGTNINCRGVVRWNGKPLSTLNCAPKRIEAEVTDSQLATGGYATVDLSTPAPWSPQHYPFTWKGISNPLRFSVLSTAPVFGGLSPSHARAGGGSLKVTAVGGYFNPSTELLWNGTALTVTSRSKSRLVATVPASLVAAAATAQVTVRTPAPGGGSAKLPYRVVKQAPAITALSPGFVTPGAADFTLTVSGSHFNSSSVVYWDGNPLDTTFVSEDELQAAVPAADVAGGGVAIIAVVNPSASGGASPDASFAIDASGSVVMEPSETFNDVDWDPVNSVFYASVPSTAAVNPDSIVTLAPGPATVTGAVATDIEPNLVAVSSDSDFLYITSATSVAMERYSLPALAQSTTVSLMDHKLPVANQPASALQASPVYPYIVMIRNGDFGLIFGGSHHTETSGAACKNFGWRPDGNMVYCDLGEPWSASLDLTDTMDVTGRATSAMLLGTRMHVDAASSFIYSDGSTSVIDPAPLPMTQVGTLPVSGILVPDTTLGCVYMVYQTPAQDGTQDYTVACHSTADYTLARSITVSSVDGTPKKLLRWGNEGLAFLTDTGHVYIVSGQVVTGD